MKNIKEIRLILDDKFCKINRVRKKIKELQNFDVSDDFAKNIYNQLVEKELFLSEVYKSKEISFIPIKNGRLSIGGRPNDQKITELKQLGVTSVVTLLKNNEFEAKKFKTLLNDLNINWIHFPMFASKLEKTPEFKLKTNAVYDKLIEKLKVGETFFIHCAAGIHRTGAFTNGLLLKIGFSPEESKEMIYKMRKVTAIEAVAKHWNWSKNIIK